MRLDARSASERYALRRRATWTAILTASRVSFLGLGPQPPTPEWGAMLSAGRTYITSNPQLATIPGLAILLVALGFNLLGDGLRDALDPRLRR
jgi:ABC-type dipeptide/oligopeptide/nickel transport system permease subunit